MKRPVEKTVKEMLWPFTKHFLNIGWEIPAKSEVGLGWGVPYNL